VMVRVETTPFARIQLQVSNSGVALQLKSGNQSVKVAVGAELVLRFFVDVDDLQGAPAARINLCRCNGDMKTQVSTVSQKPEEGSPVSTRSSLSLVSGASDETADVRWIAFVEEIDVSIKGFSQTPIQNIDQDMNHGFDSFKQLVKSWLCFHVPNICAATVLFIILSADQGLMLLIYVMLCLNLLYAFHFVERNSSAFKQWQSVFVAKKRLRYFNYFMLLLQGSYLLLETVYNKACFDAVASDCNGSVRRASFVDTKVFGRNTNVPIANSDLFGTLLGLDNGTSHSGSLTRAAVLLLIIWISSMAVESSYFSHRAGGVMWYRAQSCNVHNRRRLLSFVFRLQQGSRVATRQLSGMLFVRSLLRKLNREAESEGGQKDKTTKFKGQLHSNVNAKSIMKVTVTNAGVEMLNGEYYSLPSQHTQFKKLWNNSRVWQDPSRDAWLISKARANYPGLVEFDYYECNGSSGKPISDCTHGWQACASLSLAASNAPPAIAVSKCSRIETIAVTLKLKVRGLVTHAALAKMGHLVSYSVDLEAFSTADIVLLIFDWIWVKVSDFLVFVSMLWHAYSNHDLPAVALLVTYIGFAAIQYPEIKSGYYFFAIAWVSLELLLREIVSWHYFDLNADCIRKKQSFVSLCALIDDSGSFLPIVVLLFSILFAIDAQVQLGTFRGWAHFLKRSAPSLTHKEQRENTGGGFLKYLFQRDKNSAKENQQDVRWYRKNGTGEWVCYATAHNKDIEHAFETNQTYISDPLDNQYFLDLLSKRRCHIEDASDSRPIRRVQQSAPPRRKKDQTKLCQYCSTHNLRVSSSAHEYNGVASIRGPSSSQLAGSSGHRIFVRSFLCASCGSPMSDEMLPLRWKDFNRQVTTAVSRAVSGTSLQKALCAGNMSIYHTQFSPNILERIYTSHPLIADAFVWARWVQTKVTIIVFVRPAKGFWVNAEGDSQTATENKVQKLLTIAVRTSARSDAKESLVEWPPELLLPSKVHVCNLSDGEKFPWTMTRVSAARRRLQFRRHFDTTLNSMLNSSNAAKSACAEWPPGWHFSSSSTQEQRKVGLWYLTAYVPQSVFASDAHGEQWKRSSLYLVPRSLVIETPVDLHPTPPEWVPLFACVSGAPLTANLMRNIHTKLLAALRHMCHQVKRGAYATVDAVSVTGPAIDSKQMTDVGFAPGSHPERKPTDLVQRFEVNLRAALKRRHANNSGVLAVQQLIKTRDATTVALTAMSLARIRDVVERSTPPMAQHTNLPNAVAKRVQLWLHDLYRFDIRRDRYKHRLLSDNHDLVMEAEEASNWEVESTTNRSRSPTSSPAPSLIRQHDSAALKSEKTMGVIKRDSSFSNAMKQDSALGTNELRPGDIVVINNVVGNSCNGYCAFTNDSEHAGGDDGNWLGWTIPASQEFQGLPMQAIEFLPTPKLLVALHDFEPVHQGRDLGLKFGQRLIAIDYSPVKPWWLGYVEDSPSIIGEFPRDYCAEAVPPPNRQADVEHSISKREWLCDDCDDDGEEPEQEAALALCGVPAHISRRNPGALLVPVCRSFSIVPAVIS
jgi:hypothetical protein